MPHRPFAFLHIYVPLGLAHSSCSVVGVTFLHFPFVTMVCVPFFCPLPVTSVVFHPFYQFCTIFPLPCDPVRYFVVAHCHNATLFSEQWSRFYLLIWLSRLHPGSPMHHSHSFVPSSRTSNPIKCSDCGAVCCVALWPPVNNKSGLTSTNDLFRYLSGGVASMVSSGHLSDPLRSQFSDHSPFTSRHLIIHLDNFTFSIHNTFGYVPVLCTAFELLSSILWYIFTTCTVLLVLHRLRVTLINSIIHFHNQLP